MRISLLNLVADPYRLILKTEFKYGLSRVKLVLGLREGDAAWTVHDFRGYLFSPVCRKTVHYQWILVTAGEKLFVYLKRPEDLGSLSFFPHAYPDVGVDHVGVSPAEAGS